MGGVGFALVTLAYCALMHSELGFGYLAGIAGAATLSFVLWRVGDRIPLRWVSAAGSLMVVTCIGLTAWGYAQTRTLDFPVFMGLVMFMTGVLHLYRAWLIINSILCLVTWGILGFAAAGREFAAIGVSLLTVAAITLMVQHIAMTYFLATDRLRLTELEHARAEQVLREQLWHNQRLESIGTLAGGVAHDMNNMLAAIVTLSELAREHPDQPCRDDLDQVLSAAKRGTELTRNLLAFSRRSTYHKVNLDVAPLVQGVTRLLERTLAKRVDFLISGATARAIEGDEAHLSQALVNLCLNGVDAMEGKGTLEITIGDRSVGLDVATRLDLAPGMYVTIAVRDRGTGIPPDVIPRIFEPFFTTKGVDKGTGLGLAMVYGTLKSHGGAITAESELGDGAVFTMYIPALPARTAAIQAPAPALPVRPVSADAARLHVLVVDDEPLVREATRRCMESGGFRVTCASDGKAACERFEPGQFALVLMDMAMPGMSGAECFAELRRSDPSVKVILVTGYTQQADAQACLEAGACGLVAKPYRRVELLDAARRALGETS